MPPRQSGASAKAPKSKSLAEELTQAYNSGGLNSINKDFGDGKNVFYGVLTAIREQKTSFGNTSCFEFVDDEGLTWTLLSKSQALVKVLSPLLGKDERLIVWKDTNLSGEGRWMIDYAS